MLKKKTKSSRTYNVSGRPHLHTVSKSGKSLFFNTDIKKKLPLIKFYIELTSGLSDTQMLDHYHIEKLI